MKQALKWLYPGLGVKRWIMLGLVGVVVAITGLGLIGGWLLLAYLEYSLLSVVTTLIGDFPPSLVGYGLLILGIFIVAQALRYGVKSITKAFLPEQEARLVEVLVQQNVLAKGPKVVVIGGGTGLSVLLRGLKEFTNNLTAIVTVADDGGSSGRLRGEFGILPPGDIRSCLTALADTEPLLERLFQHRFTSGSGLEGHSFGNLFIAALTEITGDFEQAIRESSKVLAVRGRVLPVTLDDITLCAKLHDGRVVCGESQVPRANGSIKQVYLQPEKATPSPEALAAIRDADAIVFGPGSLYTSVIPNLLVPEIAQAVCQTAAVKIYVCNVMTQPGETTGYTAIEHVKALLENGCPELLTHVVVNTAPIMPELLARYHEQGADVVTVDAEELAAVGLQVIADDFITQDDYVRHDSARLARCVFRIILRSGLTKEGRRWRERHVKSTKEVE